MRQSSLPRGFTLLEITIVLVLLGLVLALVTQIGTTLQRQLADGGDRAAALERLRDAAAILPLDLRGLSSAGGDIVPGEARDTSLQVQVTFASGVICAVAGTRVLLALGTRADGTVRAAVPAAGDTLWLLATQDSAERWLSLPARAVANAPDPCIIARGSGTPTVVDTARLVSVDVGVALGDAVIRPLLSSFDSSRASIGPGAPVRITRPLRYDFYRAGDGRWYLGLREWDAGSGSFPIVQPVSGPFRAPAAGQGSGLQLRYFDSTGTEVPSGAPDTRPIARIEITLRALSMRRSGPPRPQGQRRVTDSLVLAVALRNRRP